jgi:hypothetical protein
MMTVEDWARLILTTLSILAIVGGGIRWLVKHYLNELKPNSGSSLKDSVNRLEEDHKRLADKVDHLYEILIDFIANQNSKNSKKTKSTKP